MLAGKHQLTIRAVAPAYPGEDVEVSKMIEVLPYYRHTMNLVAGNDLSGHGGKK